MKVKGFQMKETAPIRPALALAVALFALPAAGQNVANGKDINGVCAGCHGEFGQGGKRGEYPRIGGQRSGYLEEQLRSFRARKRLNLPMFPYTQERELPDEDIRDVSAYLAGVKLSNKYPTFKDTDDALTRLEAMEKVMIVSRVEGDLAKGETLYQKGCATCHAKTGKGRGKFPRLVGQYTNYLKKQMDAYVKCERPHDEAETGGILNTLKEQDMQDILAYLTSIQEVED